MSILTPPLAQLAPGASGVDLTSDPDSPFSPASPGVPAGPCGPTAPGIPGTPCGPCGPVAPASPGVPVDPFGPVGPVAPVGPCGIVICVHSAGLPLGPSVQAHSVFVVLLYATPPPTRHGIDTQTPATQVSSVFVEVNIAVSPAVLLLQAGKLEGELDIRSTVYTPLVGDVVADPVDGFASLLHPAMLISPPPRTVSARIRLIMFTPSSSTSLSVRGEPRKLCVREQ